MAGYDFDSLTIDLQHGLVDYQTALTMLQAMTASGVTPMARVPWNEPGIIMKLLDGGALGIICPMVNTAEDAKAFVGAMRYAPAGYRVVWTDTRRAYPWVKIIILNLMRHWCHRR